MDNIDDPVEVVKRFLPVLTKEEFYKVFWLVVNYMAENYATKPENKEKDRE